MSLIRYLFIDHAERSFADVIRGIAVREVFYSRFQCHDLKLVLRRYLEGIIEIDAFIRVAGELRDIFRIYLLIIQINTHRDLLPKFYRIEKLIALIENIHVEIYTLVVVDGIDIPTDEAFSVNVRCGEVESNHPDVYCSTLCNIRTNGYSTGYIKGISFQCSVLWWFERQ